MNVTQSPRADLDSTGKPLPVNSGDPVDKFGVLELYPTADNGRIWISKWDNGKERVFGNHNNDPYDSEFITSVARGLQDDSPVGLGEGSYETAGDGILKISGEYPRMYVADPSKNWRNVEITVYGKRMSDSNISWGGLQAYARTNHGGFPLLTKEGNLSEEINECDTRGYGAQLTYHGEALFEKETAHHKIEGYAQVQTKTVWNGGMPKNTWIGYKFVVRDAEGGKNVVLELYRDMTGGVNGGNWEKVIKFKDDGSNFGTRNAPCNDVIKPGLALTASDNRPGSESGKPNSSIYFRSDGVNTDGLLYKWASIREIDPLQ